MYVCAYLYMRVRACVLLSAISFFSPLTLSHTRHLSLSSYSDTQALLEAGATIDSVDESGWTPAIWAAVQGHKELLLLLIGAGADYKVRV